MKNNRKGLVVGLILFLITFSGLSYLIGYLFYNKIVSESDFSNSDVVDSENNNLNDITSFYEKFMGIYEFNYDEEKMHCPSESDYGYVHLELGKDGNASVKYGEYCSGGYSASGKYYVSSNQIIIINDDCVPNINEEYCGIPNCSYKVIYDYEIVDNEIVIKDYIHNLNKVS